MTNDGIGDRRSEERRRPRVHLVHGPTPIVRRPALDDLVGAEVWIKRDDATAGPESGNKLRKLEFLVADAMDRGARAIVTCGGLQSNHARATALVCAQMGLRSVLLLRVPDPAKAREEPLPLSGNVLLDKLAGAEIRFVSPDEYRERSGMLEQARVDTEDKGLPTYIVPEGGSNGLGSLGYVEAMREVRRQIDLGLAGPSRGEGDASIPHFDVVAHACGSGGTAAGVALGAARFGVAREAWAFPVCDDNAYFKKVIARIALEARSHEPSLPEIAFLEPGTGHAVAPDGAARMIVDDRAKGPAYAVMSEEQKRFLVRVARTTGMLFDPVYTGKALWGLAEAVANGDIRMGSRVLFLHTGGLPGLLAQGEELRSALG
ncbi:MAG: pyridoxal-phosphate dependent enzyme [Deltaproteobacteria bacterium]|nr:pyridoxal-phosphate dependent enzyme [Deltaproteobacteria bacterium]